MTCSRGSGDSLWPLDGTGYEPSPCASATSDAGTLPLSPALVAEIRAYLGDRVDYDHFGRWKANREAALLHGIAIFGPDALPDVLDYFAGREDDEGRAIYQRMKEEGC